jgi:hypothetical protein
MLANFDTKLAASRLTGEMAKFRLCINKKLYTPRINSVAFFNNGEETPVEGEKTSLTAG